MAYTRLAAPPPLADVVDHFWSFDDQAMAAPRGTLFADGGFDLMFDFGGPIWTWTRGRAERWTGCWVAGPRTSVDRIALDDARVNLAGVRLRPGTAPAVLGVPAASLVDRVVALDLLWGARAARTLERVAVAPDAAARLRVLCETMGEVAAHAEVHGTVAAEIDRLLHRPQEGTIDDLRRRMGVSHKHLTRLFRHHVGMTPKLFQRVARFRLVLARVQRAAAAVDWARLAVECGYFDQAHLCTDFRGFSGVTPTAYAPPPIAPPPYLPWAGPASRMAATVPLPPT